MSPYGVTGLFERTMAHVLRAMRTERAQLIYLMDIFIREPSLDWLVSIKISINILEKQLHRFVKVCKGDILVTQQGNFRKLFLWA